MNSYLPVYSAVVFLVILVFVIYYKKRSSQNYRELLLSGVLKNIDEAIITVNPDFEIEFANASAERILKQDRQNLSFKKINTVFEDLPVQYYSPSQIPDRSGAEDPLISVEINCKDNQNNKIPVVLSVKKLFEKGHGNILGLNSKKLLGYVYIFKDISELKHSVSAILEKSEEIEQENFNLKNLQDELESEKASALEKVQNRTRIFEEEHARLLASINNLSLGFLMTDQYRNILLANNKSYSFLTSLKDKKSTVADLQKAMEIGIDLDGQVEKALIEKNPINIGDTIIAGKFMKIFISPIVIDKSGDVIGAIILFEDVNSQHILEESKEDLFSIASHELRTPLTAIYGYTSLIKQIYFDDLKDAELKNIIDNVGKLSKKLASSINNFLDSSKLEQDRIELKKENCDLYTVVNEAIKGTEQAALEKNLYIKFDVPQSPITLMGDQARLVQVFTILISNSIKFTQIGGIRITVQLQEDRVKMSVQDTGIGIAKEDIKLIFSKFQHTEENLLTRQEGAGLGLHIAKLLVEKMGGNIWIEQTELNNGSIFSFTIPVANS